MAVKADLLANLDVAEEQIIFYQSHLDIYIEDAFAPIKLTRDQHIIARAFGNCSDIKIVQSRGSGKTWLTALCCHALCTLYPGTIVIICSSTGNQGTLVIQKLKMLAEQNPNIANEIRANSARNLVLVSGDRSRVNYKNGSYMESGPIESLRGRRAKIIVVDEAPDIDQDDLHAIVDPIKNYRRDISFNYGFDDYPSKSIAITSACEKTNSFYEEFLKTTRLMAVGDPNAFSCSLDYLAAVANGITPLDFFMSEKARMPASVFAKEYESIFVGAVSNSAFPFELVESCRTLKKVELEQPKGSKSRYVISLDIATSEAKGSDNSIIVVVKFVERSDGSFAKKLVYLRSYSGKKLDFLANEIRELYHSKFPHAEKIIYDARGLGDSLDRFFDTEYLSPVTGREYPPLVVDDKPSVNGQALQILHPFRAVQTLNQRIYTNLRVALEQRTIELPAQSRVMAAEEAESGQKLSMYEKAVFLEADALQFEMGNIVSKVTGSGSVIYDVPRAGLHKDRYSAFAMANDYICELEKASIRKRKTGPTVIGFTSSI